MISTKVSYNNFTAKRGIHFAALGRTGHHAIIHWVLRQLPEPTLNLGNVLGSNPEESWYFNDGFHQWSTQFDGPASPYRPEDLSRTQYIAVDSQNFNVDEIPAVNLEFPTIIVVRDIRNWLASKQKGGTNIGPHNVEMWIKYMEQVMYLRDYLPKSVNWFPVSFNNWFSRESYRRGIVYRLNDQFGYKVQFNDRGLNEILENPPRSPRSGSSFDRMSFQGKAQKMDVLKRWEVYRDDPVTNSIITGRAMELNKKYFGDMY